MNPFATPQSILITGALSGIGATLALGYAQLGRQMFRGGRDPERLAAIAQRVEQAGATCETRIVDVTDSEAMTDWMTGSDHRAPLDLVIANAGISASARKRHNAVRHSDAAIFATNVDGVINTVTPAFEQMRIRKHGQIAIMSSLASFRAFREAPTYCASKAAVRFYGTGLRRAYAAEGIGVSVICPGFIRSPMTNANDFHMPLLMDSDAFPLLMYIAVRVMAMF